MDDRKIFECVAKIPGIRAVQICDMLDEELGDVSEALKSLVDAGELSRRAGFAPNGVAAQLYDFSDYFKSTNEYKAVMAAMTPADAPLPAELVEQLSKAGQAEVVTGQPAKVGEVPSRAERAIAFILKHGSATDDELRTELVMRQGEYPSSILGHAMKTGRLTRVNNRWVPGDGRPMAAPPAAKPFSESIIASNKAPTPIPAVTPFLAERAKPGPKPGGGAGKPKAAPMVAAPPLAPADDQFIEVPEPQPMLPALRCGIWSDGVVELQRNGKPVAVLMQAEAEFMAKFLAGLGAKVAA
jgi:hypothetical protein